MSKRIIYEIPFYQITVIKTGRSAGHFLLIASLAGLLLENIIDGMFLGISHKNETFHPLTGLPDDRSVRGMFAIFSGAAIGSAVFLPMKKQKFVNDGSVASIQKFKADLKAYFDS